MARLSPARNSLAAARCPAAPLPARNSLAAARCPAAPLPARLFEDAA